MNEDILSFVWRFQYFETEDLRTDDHAILSVVRTGHRNANAGPDFSEARVLIDGILWAGSVEIHVRSSDWFVHTHEQNRAYEGVILHVVWENDRPIVRRDGTLLPTLTLKGLVKKSVLERYVQLREENCSIPCARMFASVPDLHKLAMLDRILLERLDRKAGEVKVLLKNNKDDWEETAYQWLGKQYGFKLNEQPFLRLTQIVPFKIIQKHRFRLSQIEALLFGASGLIPDLPGEAYAQLLRKEFLFLKNKYKLEDGQILAHEWKYARLRPAGFPSVRLAQFAALLYNQERIFSRLLSGTADDLTGVFQATQSDYWTDHYVFGKKSKGKVPHMGTEAARLLIINAVVPLLVAYAQQRGQPELIDQAVGLLNGLPAENNHITREWVHLGMQVKAAADAQSLIEWYNMYCTPKRCLECTVGAALVRSA